MNSKILLRAIWLFVLLPTAVVAAFWTLMAVPVLLSLVTDSGISLFHRGHVLIALLVLPGLFGLATLSTLYDRFAKDKPLGNVNVHLAGLACGCLTSFALAFLVPGQMLSLWPVIAAIYFFFRLRLARQHAA